MYTEKYIFKSQILNMIKYNTHIQTFWYSNKLYVNYIWLIIIPR